MDRQPAKVLTIAEKVRIVRLYTQCQENAREASRRFAQETNGSVAPMTVIRINSTFDETGSVADRPRSGRPRSGRSDENVQTVQEIITKEPTTSTRRLSAESQIKHSSVYRILKKDLKFKSTIPTLCHALNEDDPDRRKEFCEIFLNRFNDNSLRYILWSDEAHFKLNGHVNRHNSVYWSQENPHRTMEVVQQGPGVMVWCGIINDSIIGPYFFDGSVNGERYLVMLQQYLWPIVSQMENNNQIFFQQDGAQPHYTLAVRQFLDSHFPQRWLGRRGPIEWPARSPDLTPPDFWLWGSIKEQVYGRRPQTLTHLRQFIMEEIALQTPEMIQSVTHSIRRRYERLLENDGKQLTS